MDYAFLIKSALTLWWLVPILIVANISKSSWWKGVVGETFVKISAWRRLPIDTYHRIHNVTLLTQDGTTTQIDHIFVSKYGVFVVETKNMKGWVFGSEKQPQWTLKLNKKTYTIQNPIHQNYKHVKALQATLGLEYEVIHSVIAFVGDSRFMTALPVNVTQGSNYITYIESFEDVVFSDSEVRALFNRIKSERLKPSLKTSREHIKQQKKRFS